ncbi:MAG: ABC transporter permease DevC [Jaaginema sp. PMC 1079.18]|nr:ABC transporter permease DevC [Jaaginema sp. PMC 1080.18]MEC4851865.1 ABC transporter permease DevC [Jaaginema sp. PMC 1079.18]MEC4866429.1 ABC transporter permease DevC [Jaaginema sp. PMC 1078.18]
MAWFPRRFSRISLAWRQLTYNKIRLVVAITGITFAVILMFMQLAFLDSLYDSQTALHQRLQGDLVLFNSQMKTLASTEEFPRQYLYRALNISGVASINYLYHAQRPLKYGDTLGGKGAIIIGINPENPAIAFPDAENLLPKINTIGTVLFDRNSDVKEYGNILTDLANQPYIKAEIAGRQVRIVDTVDFAGASFADDGNIITSVATFLKVSDRRADDITLGLVRLQPQANAQAVLAAIKAQTPDLIQVMTIAEFIAYEKNYWSTSAPIGFVFGVGVFVGFLVGVVIVSQILFNEVSEHLPDYALLKARGYRDRYFLKVLFQEASIIAILGYVPGFIAALGLYAVSRDATALPIIMTTPRAIIVLGLTLTMCFTSGAIAMRKLKDADPAELFS